MYFYSPPPTRSLTKILENLLRSARRGAQLQLVIEFAHGRVRSKEPGQHELVPPRCGGRDSRNDLSLRVGQADLFRVLPPEEGLLARGLVRHPPDLDRTAVSLRGGTGEVGGGRGGRREAEEIRERRGVDVAGRRRDVDIVDRAFELRVCCIVLYRQRRKGKQVRILELVAGRGIRVGRAGLPTKKGGKRNSPRSGCRGGGSCRSGSPTRSLRRAVSRRGTAGHRGPWRFLRSDGFWFKLISTGGFW